MRRSGSQTLCLPMNSHVDSGGEAPGANEGQIYTCHGVELSCFSHVDGCAATFKSSHNVGLNLLHNDIIFTLEIEPVYCMYSADNPAEATVQCGLCMEAALCSTNYLNVSFFRWHAAGIMCSIWIWILKLWHCQVLNGLNVDVLMCSLAGINYVFMGGLAGTNVYTNLFQWLWPLGPLLNL